MAEIPREQIRSVEQPNCILCGTPGSILYTGLQDHLFSAPGEWDLRQCPAGDCGLTWLDPMMDPTDIHLAYQNYYTHGVQDRRGVPGVTERGGIKASLAKILGYQERQRRSFLMNLQDVEPGRMLEIGCGRGDRLVAFRQLGWDVVGQDPDPLAASRGQDLYDVDILQEPVEKISLPEGSLDAIVMNHVLEHLHNPLELLRECYRLLKPGGQLSLATPNSQSLGHRVFGRHWRGLEPPRHLYIYRCGALSRLLAQTGDWNAYIATTAINASGTVVRDSFLLLAGSRGRKIEQKDQRVALASHLFRLVEDALVSERRQLGEECIVLASKPLAC